MQTITPDQAMSQLYPPGGRAARAAAAGDGPAAGLDVMARLELHSASLAESARRLAARGAWEECHPVDIAPAQSAAAGVLDEGDSWGPRVGWAWHVLLLSATLGPAGTAMSVYRDAPQPMNLLLGPVASGIWEPQALILTPGHRLVWTSAGDGLTVASGLAVEVAIASLPAYLMAGR